MTIRAVPNIDEQKRTAKAEASRIDEQRKAFGIEGLNKKSEELKKAMAENDTPPPNDILTQVPIPDTSNVNSLPSTIQERGGDIFGDASKLKMLNLNEFPLPINVTACATDSNFGYVRIIIFHSISLETRRK